MHNAVRAELNRRLQLLHSYVPKSGQHDNVQTVDNN